MKKKLISIRYDVLVELVSKVDRMQRTLDALQGALPPPPIPTLRSLAVDAATGEPGGHKRLMEAIEREVERSGRSRAEVMEEAMQVTAERR